MLLIELTNRPLAQNNSLRRRIDDERMKGAKLVGSGSYASVLDHTYDDADKVAKYSADPAYKKFIDVVCKSNNPYFPQVDVSSTEKLDDNGSYHLTIMEKLVELESLEINQLWSIIRCLGLTHDVIGMIVDVKSNLVENIVEWIWTWVTDPSRIPRQASHDIHLVEAIKAINKLLKHFKRDIHSGNIMVRMTPYGPHLVFTDPIC